MKRTHFFLIFGLVVFSLTFLEGCSKADNPKGVVADFLAAAKSSDASKIEKTISFERLLLEKTGEEYLKTKPEDRARELEAFKKNILNSFVSGNMKYFGQMDFKIASERVTGDKAEVHVNNRKEKGSRFLFSLAREGGVWKIYKIANL